MWVDAQLKKKRFREKTRFTRYFSVVSGNHLASPPICHLNKHTTLTAINGTKESKTNLLGLSKEFTDK